MNKWGWIAVGAGATLGVLSLVGIGLEEILRHVNGQVNTADGYALGIFVVPAQSRVGHQKQVQVVVTNNGQPVTNASVKVTVTRNSGTQEANLITDSSGIASFQLVTFSPQTMQIRASFITPTNKAISDQVSANWIGAIGGPLPPQPLPAQQAGRLLPAAPITVMQPYTGN